jgi:hypothetical protein
MMSKRVLAIGGVIVLMLLAACANRTASPIVSPTGTREASETAMPTVTAAARMTEDVRDQTETAVALLPTSTATLTPTATQTPKEEAREILMPLCTFYEPFIDGNIQRHEFEFTQETKEFHLLGRFGGQIIVENETVNALILNSSVISKDFDYTLSGILKSIGPPKEIWLEIYPESMHKPHYIISLFYPDKGIEVGATGFGQVHGDIFEVCPYNFRLISHTTTDSYPPVFLFWSASEKITFENLGSAVFGYTNWDYNRQYHLLLQDITEDFTEIDFYETYIDPNATACFNVDLTKLP